MVKPKSVWLTQAGLVPNHALAKCHSTIKKIFPGLAQRLPVCIDENGIEAKQGSVSTEYRCNSLACAKNSNLNKAKNGDQF